MKQMLGTINGHKCLTILLVAFVAIVAMLSYRGGTGLKPQFIKTGKASQRQEANSRIDRAAIGNSASTSPQAGATGPHISLSEPQHLTGKHDGNAATNAA